MNVIRREALVLYRSNVHGHIGKSVDGFDRIYEGSCVGVQVMNKTMKLLTVCFGE